MKRTIKISIWSAVIIIALAVIFFVGYGVKAKSEGKKMTPAETGQIIDSIFTIKDTFVNLYLIKSGDRYIAVDAGNSIDGVKEGLAKLNICPDSVIAVLLTHTDGDHVAAIKLFPNASIYISKQEETLINGKKSRFLFFGNSIAGRSYTTLTDKQIITPLHLKIQGILVPGHTPGSMSYLINDRYLFTGDALCLKDGKICGFNKFFNMDTKTALQSMGKLTNIQGVEYIFTAHYGFTNSYNEAVKDWGK